MGDSDDEYERRKGRDKFRRERNDYEHRDERRSGRETREWDHDRSAGRSREAWSSRSRERRDDYRDYDSRRRDRGYSPGARRDMSPPVAKRMRRENWDDGYHGAYGGMGYGHHVAGGGPPHHGYGGPDADLGGRDMHGHQQGGGYGQRDSDHPTQPAIMSFKLFLSQQDDSISDQDAIKKYNEYKLDFKRQQINEFFLAHKEEEWFKSKYHPEECEKRREEVKEALKKRCHVFMELLNSGRMENAACDIDKSDDLVKLLDAGVIKMEGGTDFDLTILDQPDTEDGGGARSRNNSECVTDSLSPDEKKRKKKEESKDKKPDEPLKLPISGEQKELMKQAQEFSKQQQAKNGTEQPEEKQEEKKPKKKKRHRDKTEYNYESGSESESGSGTESEPEPAPPGLEDEPEPPPPGIDLSNQSLNSTDGSSSLEEKVKSEETKKEQKEATEDEKELDTAAEGTGNGDKLKPRPLHKTNSIFLRNLAPSITKQEVEAMCKRYQGFIRVALQDPQSERNFFRRGWVTFSKNVNIKEICWNLNNIRLRDCELGATLNRELKQRVRPVTGLTAHKQVVKADLKAAAKVLQNLDQKWGIWDEPGDEKSDPSKEMSFSIISKNPVLKNITDYLVEEGDFEEEELMGQTTQEAEKETPTDLSIERDENAIKALDRLVLYLRMVHSVDYYSASVYPNEDEMPHRCGIMHARGVPPSAKITESDISDWIKNFQEKIKNIAETQDVLPDAEAVRLGKKDAEAEVEKFVTTNTQELSKDKWLCPISGKKFKGPDFVRKHIFNKHGEKVEEVKKEVQFFNNYLLDAKRPQLPEHPGSKNTSTPGGSSQSSQYTGNHGGYQQSPHQQAMMAFSQSRGHMMYGNQPSFAQPGYGGRDSYRGDHYMRSPYSSRGLRSNIPGGKWNSEHRRSDPRGIIEYRDLDAPDDNDFF